MLMNDKVSRRGSVIYDSRGDCLPLEEAGELSNDPGREVDLDLRRPCPSVIGGGARWVAAQSASDRDFSTCGGSDIFPDESGWEYG